VPIESLFYVLLNGAVNPAEPHWFGINIQGNWSHHHVMKSLPHKIKDKLCQSGDDGSE